MAPSSLDKHSFSDHADIEKHDAPRTTTHAVDDLNDGVPRHKGIFGTLWRFAHRFDAYGAETRGIERVLPEDRPVVSNFSRISYHVVCPESLKAN